MSPVVVLEAMLLTARVICLQLFSDCARAAASRTFCTAGISRPMRMAMMAMTTSSSIKVNPGDGRFELRNMDTFPLRKPMRRENPWKRGLLSRRDTTIVIEPLTVREHFRYSGRGEGCQRGRQSLL